MKYKVLNIAVAIIIMIMGYSCNNNQGITTVDDMVVTAEQSTTPITVDILKQKIDDGEMILLLDVREPNEFNAGYIPGALNIPRGVLEFKINNEKFWEEAMLYMPLPEEEIIVYCKKGKRSILAAETLQKLGYTNVTYLDGGWKNWEMNYPLIYEKNLDANAHDDGGEVGGC